MSVLISGASGFVGSHLARCLVSQGEKVVSLVHDCVGWNKWIQESLKSTVRVSGDIRDIHLLERVLNHYEVDTVYHLAAQSIVKHAYKDPINTYDVNVMGTVKLLEACRQLDVERVLVQSTDKVFGNKRGANVDDQFIPTEPYGTSKICVDVAAQSFALTYGMNVIVTRCCNIYGYDWNNRIVPNTIRACLRGESPIIFKDEKSERQYLYIDDATDSFINIMKGKYRFSGNIVHVATPEVKNQEEVVLEVLKHFPSLKPQYVEKPKLKEIAVQSMIPALPLEYTTFEEGIELTINAFRRNG